MMKPLHALPALVAALLISVLPGCASVRVDRPVEPVTGASQARSADCVGGIERGAGQPHTEQGNPDLTVIGYQLAAWVALLIVLGLGWLIYTLAEVIADSLDMPYDDAVKLVEDETRLSLTP